MAKQNMKMFSADEVKEMLADLQNGQKNGHKLKQRIGVTFAVIGLFIVGLLAYMAITGTAKKIYYAGENFPTLQKTVDEELVPKVAKLEEGQQELEKDVEIIKVKQEDIWKAVVPSYQREKTEIVLRGNGHE